jgi:alpha-ketoglutarate-dependent taurine dioxygenase
VATTETAAMAVRGARDCDALTDESVRMWTLDGGRPLFITPRNGALQFKDEFLAWAKSRRSALDDLILMRGAVVLRGFPLATAQDFDDFVALFPTYEPGYVGGRSPRAAVAGKVMEATRYAADRKLSLHQEMAYLRDYPARIAFFCKKPAEQGGETIIGDMKEFTRRLPADLVDQLERHGIRNVRNYAPAGSSTKIVATSDGKAWDESFGTRERADVEAICASMGLEPIWHDDGYLTVVNDTEAFATHPVTGDRIYRNILHAHYIYKDQPGQRPRSAQSGSGCLFGNGLEPSRETAQMLLAAFDDMTVCWKWEAGDIMLLDNLLVAHGRNPYVGERETLVALLD